MTTRRIRWYLVMASALALPAFAQTNATRTIAAPDYGSDVSAGALSNDNFNTPESDGRVGVKYFAYGVEAFRKHDYQHAIDMYKVAASWAYKPAEYDLGVMYFRGQGVPVDRPLGAAWMVLAAERGEPRYVQARDLMITVLSKPEFARTDELWGELKKTYGDGVALRRAKAQWAYVRTHKAGTRTGGTTGELLVGGMDSGHTPGVATVHSSTSLLQSGILDGSIAYRQFRQSDNPYDPIFLKKRAGTATIEPLQQIKSGSDKHPPSKKDGAQPTQPSDS